MRDYLNEGDAEAACRVLQESFDFLTRYYSSLSYSAAVALGVSNPALDELGKTARTFDEIEELLKRSLEALGEKATEELPKALRTVFYVGSTRQDPTPRRHSRLLQLSGIPIRGYRLLGEWCGLQAGVGDLQGSGKCSREMRRYLPILKEWITAAANYFRDAIHRGHVSADGTALELTVKLEGYTLSTGGLLTIPVWLAEQSARLPSRGFASASQPEPEPPAEAPVAEPVEPAAEPAEEPPEETVEPAEEAVAEAPVPEVTAVPEPADEPAIQAEPVAMAEPEQAAEPESAVVVEVEEEAVEPEPEAPRTADPPAAQPDEKIEETPEPVTEAGSPEPVQAPEPPPVEPEKVSPRAEPASEEPREPVLAAVPTSKLELSAEQAEALAAKADPAPQSVQSHVEPEKAEPEKEPKTEVAAEKPAVPEVKLESPEPESKPVVPVTAPLGTPTTPLGQATVGGAPVPTPRPIGPKPEDPVLAALWAVESGVDLEDLEPDVPERFDEVLVDADFPEPLANALNDLNEAIEANDSLLIFGQLQRSLDLMLQYFAGLTCALMQEIDPEALEDIDLEARPDLAENVEMLGTALSSLESHWETNDAATLLWSVFYDVTLSAGDPEWAYLHTRLLGVEGAPPGKYREISEFCGQKPGQDAEGAAEARIEIARYLPVLSFWLENATPLFLESEVDFIEEDDGKALSWAATLVGEALDGSLSSLWLEVDPERFDLPSPERIPVTIPAECPDVLEVLLNELNETLEKGELEKVATYTRNALDFLLQYFAGCAGSAWQQEGRMTPEAAKLFSGDASLDEKQRLLVLGLGSLGTTSVIGKGLAKTFPRSSLHFKQLASRSAPKGTQTVADWGLSREPESEENIYHYLGVLRSWLVMAAPWFLSGEQLFEEPSDKGVLEGVVVFKTFYLELVEPEYSMRLPPELLSLVALQPASQPASDDVVHPGPAPAPALDKAGLEVFVPKGAPEILEGHLQRLADSLDDRPAACAWIGASFEYLIQYFAGLLASISLDSLSPAVKGFMSPDASLRERERLLVEAATLVRRDASSDFRRILKDLFWDGQRNDAPRLHTQLLGVDGQLEEGDTLLSYWCRLRHEEEDITDAELRQFIPVLNSWTEAAEAYFEGCEHYAEDPGPEGQEEVVVVHGDEYIELVLPDYCIQVPARGYYEILYREDDDDVRREALGMLPGGYVEEAVEEDVFSGPAPVDTGELMGGATDFMGAPTELLGGATELLGAAEFGAPTAEVDDDLFKTPSFETKSLGPAPVPQPRPVRPLTPVSLEPVRPVEEREEEKPDKKKDKTKDKPGKEKADKKKARKAKAGAAVLELYKKERLEKARKRAEARARKASEEPPRMFVSISYRGLKNSPVTGTNAHAGTLEMTNQGGGELKGAVKGTHPCIRVQPRAFKGNTARVLYFIDPSDMPSSGKAGLVIQTQNEKLEIALEQLLETSWLSERPTAQAGALMFLPAVAAWFLWLFGFIFLLVPKLGAVVTEAGGLDKVKDLPTSASGLMLLFAGVLLFPMATLVPALLSSLYSKFGPEEQVELKPVLPVAMLAPTVLLATCFFLPWFKAAFLQNAVFNAVNLARQFPFFLAFNLAATGYCWANSTGLLETKIPDEGNRTTLGVALAGLNLILIFVLVFLFQ
ncbi:MAG: hypothetical protein AB7S38_17845 [Vulcanimicrobiota bacterium]